MADFTYQLRDQKTGTLLEAGTFSSDQPYYEIAKILSDTDISKSSITAVFTDENGKHADYTIVKKNPKFIKSEYNNLPGKYLDAMDYPKPRYLTCVDPEKNSYKFYQIETKNGRTHVQYGRIGDDHGQFGLREYEYDLDMYWVKYFEKLSKGYIDQSEIKDFDKQEVKTPSVVLSKIKSEMVNDIVEHLINRARNYVQKNYNYISGKENKGFSLEAVKKVDALLDDMQNMLSDDGSIKDTEAYKQKFYAVISVLPRYINNVKDYTAEALSHPQQIIDRERDLAEALKTVIEQDELVKNNKSKEATVLDKSGLKIKPVTFNEKLEIQKKMGEKIGCLTRALKVTNEKTEAAYKKCLKEKGIREEGCKLFFHGSRTENWWSIMKNGMSLNPNAVITGKMFGQGLYFAPKAAKSMGYTDQRGSYWAKGNDNRGYLALFEVAMGKEYHPHKVLGSTFKGSDLHYGCHSVYAKGGSVGLYNDEAIIYDEHQCTIRYLIETGDERNLDYKMDINNISPRSITLGEPFANADDKYIKLPVVMLTKSGREEFLKAGIDAKKPVIYMGKSDELFVMDMTTGKEYSLAEGDKELLRDRCKDKLCQCCKLERSEEGYEKFMQGLGKTYILPAKPDEKITVVKESKKEESKTIEIEEMERE